MRTVLILVALVMIASSAAGKDLMTIEITGVLGDQYGKFQGFATLHIQQKNFKWSATLTHYANGVADWSLNYAAKHDSNRDGAVVLYAPDSVMTVRGAEPVEIDFVSTDQQLLLLPLP